MSSLVRRAALVTVAGLLLAAALSGCGSKTDNTPTVEAVPVAVTEAKLGPITATNPTSAQIDPILSVPITAKSSARVMAVHAEIGAAVKSGDLLAELEDRDASAQLAQARANLAQAEAQRVDAERQYNRLSELFKAGAVSKQQVEQVQTQLSLASAQVTAASATVDLALANWERTRITAPADGVIAARMVDPGAMVGAGSPVFLLVDLSTVVVKTGVAERDVNAVKVGGSVPVVVPALGNREFTGTVEAVSPNMDRQTKSFQVRVTMPNADGTLKGGMFAQVKFPVKEQQGILVPVSALTERNGEQYLFVVENDKAKQVKVTVAVQADDTVAVEGLQAGAVVVTAGQNRLYDGAPVLIQGGGTK